MSRINRELQSISFEPIGVIYTPHVDLVNMPVQPVGAKGVEGHFELKPELAQGLTDLDGFSHITLIYFLHEVGGYDLMVKPFMDDRKHGIFATRSPKRPCAIGLSTVRLLRIEENKLFFEGADMLTGTPLLDIKPFFRQTDNRPEAISGWLDEKDETLAHSQRSDDRFVQSR
ncbi:tRNA (N6-threonylcarbamoyladenosine(37)-N6)-methyltransferase TrmO [Mangrovibacterium marinum]|uniref:tRNA-Thr(GGU) m(6)t(6)A37 methyltransferase TsaA n=1 Tax=Mangrovibacterium marinum TaxID=1639118 RepID=A0A2T5C0S3_9BACT|nr:tRNA (N6-threonylcarbamoyladenosine(37)-N6)-methyltransferase TrmO [Mangrovibacterium marinum]PTN08203.1 tRNA-Thr(GGU) m(6)t(6)A37 methyltransferase TsaA [Mangrovibacterium marinum]